MPSAAGDTDEKPQPASDEIVARLTQSQFDAVSFLNESFPSLQLSAQSSPKITRSAQIQNISTEIQSVLTRLNTHNVRSSSELTGLTDEILRSGNRLAYEVEILRGDTNSMHELLTDTLREDISQFVHKTAARNSVEGVDLNGQDSGNLDEDPAKAANRDPDFMTQLRMLGQVKGRLESVINVFGEAMKWPLPPSEQSMATSLISVSAPELGIQNTEEDDKAREIARTYRGEISDLLDSDGGGYAGLEAAAKRVDDFRRLASIWKGTAEEKNRARFVDGLAKLVEDRKKSLDARTAPQGSRSDSGQRSNSSAGRPSRPNAEGGSAAGLFRNLQRLRDDLYLE